MSLIDFIKRHIARYRDLLANLTRRNKELYYRESRGFSVNLTKRPQVEEQYNEAIDENFKPLRINSQCIQDLITDSNLDLNQFFLLDETHNNDLIKRIDKIRVADDKFQREYGISGAWLLGPYICWREEATYNGEDMLISPIFKIAIDVVKNRKKCLNLKLENNELTINPSLRLGLRKKWGIDLPEIIEEDSFKAAVDAVIAIVNKAGKNLQPFECDAIPKIPPRFKYIKDDDGNIVDKVRIKVEDVLNKKDIELYSKVTNTDFALLDVFYIDHLNASRAVLFSDYDAILEADDVHPILSELFSGKAVPSDNKYDREKIRQLDTYKENQNHFVIDIDSSQHRAIDRANNNRAVVLQGPPGTGKSQTITNLIADSIANGKKVLFVSEKRAALDVVFSRLKKCHLDSQAVLIHGNNLNKQSLYKSFLELSESVHDSDTDKMWGSVASDLDSTKNEINSYYDVLEKKHSPSGLMISDLLSKSADISRDRVSLKLSGIYSGLSYDELNKVCECLDELQSKIGKFQDYANHTWKKRKKNTVYSETFYQKLSDIVSSVKLFIDYNNKLKEKASLAGLSCDLNVIRNLDLTSDVELDIPDEWVKFSGNFYKDISLIPAYLSKIDSISMAVTKFNSDPNHISSTQDLALIEKLDKYFSAKRGVFDFITFQYWAMRSEAKKITDKWDGSPSIFKNYLTLSRCLNDFKNINSNLNMPIMSSDIDAVNLNEIVTEIRKYLSSIMAARKIVDMLELGSSAEYSDFNLNSKENIKRVIRNAQALQGDVQANEQTLGLLVNEINSNFEDTISLNERNILPICERLLESARDLSMLDSVDMTLGKIDGILRAKPPHDFIESDLIPISSSWGKYLYSNVMLRWLDDCNVSYPELRVFDSNNFLSQVEKFKSLEVDHSKLAREFVNNSLSKRWDEGRGEFSGLALLKKEANKQKKVLAPRQIMEQGALSAMMKLKPCWLMSPLSISQILPLSSGLFDIIIFDEASQVRVEDAVPSIFRANSLIVVGDPHQMPPTNFFSSSDQNDENSDDEEEETELTQSILDLASQVYPSEVLEWHYRSNSESLIQFSNRAFYGGRLISAPDPYEIDQNSAIKFSRVESAYFNQGDGNYVEAEFVAKRLIDLLEKNPGRSFGVIAMGHAQKHAIDASIEAIKASSESIKSLISAAENFTDSEGNDEGLFVKNLENVQGDERDIILISIGYAPAKPGRKLWLNFGPLSKQGGGRRLNVAITRAKRNIEVICSFDPAEIPTDEANFSSNPDLCLFGRYLKYAKAISDKCKPDVVKILDSFGVGGVVTSKKPSNFSRVVQMRLQDAGYHVSAEIGYSRFYIDLGVHHPVIPSNYVLGIECDGAIFHSSPYARDRDKLRQKMLESRGWKIARIWSQDWSKDWKSEIKKLDDLLKKILNDGEV